MAAAGRRSTGAGLFAACVASAGTDAAIGQNPRAVFKLFPVGKVEKQGAVVRIRIFDEYVDGLLGLEEWSHVNVFYWFDQNDVPEKRRILRVHPQGNDANPLTGVFACRAPVRPNLIALSVCKLVSVKGNLVNLDSLDAFDGTPVLDLKPFIPPDAPLREVRVPAWARGKK
jgi:tRNA-Thr(GGU) m(6)t(6)A37 methyltransferase TsaA